MGGRMLAEMARHPEFEPTWAWDSSPGVRDATAAECPSLEFIEEIFAQPADLFYMATPPATHIPLVRKASRAILCEKPLAVDVTEARHLVDEIQIPNAVNFPFATHPSITTLEQELTEERHGSTVRLEIRLFFNDWPRQWRLHPGSHSPSRVGSSERSFHTSPTSPTACLDQWSSSTQRSNVDRPGPSQPSAPS